MGVERVQTRSQREKGGRAGGTSTPSTAFALASKRYVPCSSLPTHADSPFRRHSSYCTSSFRLIRHCRLPTSSSRIPRSRLRCCRFEKLLSGAGSQVECETNTIPSPHPHDEREREYQILLWVLLKNVRATTNISILRTSSCLSPLVPQRCSTRILDSRRLAFFQLAR